METLRQILKRIDGRGYKAYKDIQGSYRAGEMELRVDHVQGDPFAEPSRLALRIPLDRTWVPPELVSTPLRRVAMGDLLTRIFCWALGGGAQRGSGKSGRLTVDAPGQEILPRSSCQVTTDAVELRFKAGLPAAGRRVLGREAWDMLGGDVPTAARAPSPRGSTSGTAPRATSRRWRTPLRPAPPCAPWGWWPSSRRERSSRAAAAWINARWSGARPPSDRSPSASASSWISPTAGASPAWGCPRG